MKKAIATIVLSGLFSSFAFAQYVGIGTNDPKTSLHVTGDLAVHAATTTSTAQPTVNQTITLINANNVTLPVADSLFRIYDPGGQMGNYAASSQATASLNSPGALAFELTIESIGLGSGDSLIISTSFPVPTILLAVGNNFNSPGKYIFSTSLLNIGFKSNADASTGPGFSLLLKRIYQAQQPSTGNTAYLAKSLFFNAGKGALSAGGANPPDQQGNYSAALGYGFASGDYSFAQGQYASSPGLGAVALGAASRAEGEYAFAAGIGADARGPRSVAIGNGADASGSNALALGYISQSGGNVSVAMGLQAHASDDYATAIGAQANAYGRYAVALGHDLTASGDYSMALGYRVSTNNLTGALVIGDNSTATIMNAATANSFRARFAGGYRFFTSAAISNAESCQLAAGSNAWSTTSDIRLKENFAAIDGEDFLKKIARLKLVSWNYKNQDPSKFRHYGPMAQDFYAAFGKDKYGTIGNDTTINQADFDGVNMIAIQALEKRTAGQQELIQLQKEINMRLHKEIGDMQQHLHQTNLLVAELKKEMEKLKKTNDHVSKE
jgi:hypothetical protein